MAELSSANADLPVQVRPAVEEDLPTIGRLSDRTFSAAGGAEPKVEADAVAEPSEPPGPLAVVAERNGRIVAAASARLRGQWFGGRRLLCAAIGGVAVDVEARGLGVGRSVMTALLAEAHRAGAVTSALIPSTHRFYTSLGFGVAGRRPVYAVPTTELRALPGRRPDGLRLRRAVPSDAAEVAAMVRRRAASASGLLDHSGRDEEIAENPSGYVVETDGRVAGWCELQRRAATSRQANYDLVVVDLVADEPAVELALWRLLGGDYPSALRTEAVLPPGSVLEQQLERQQDVVENGSWMLSLLDVEGALQTRGYPSGLTAQLVLAVVDPSCPWNTGRWQLSVAAGLGAVEPAPEGRPDVEVAASDLASMYAGHLDPVQALRQGRLGRATPEVVGTLRTLFAGPPAWLARAF